MQLSGFKRRDILHACSSDVRSFCDHHYQGVHQLSRRNFFLAEYAAGFRSPQLFLVFDDIGEAEREQTSDLVVISLGLKEQPKIQVLAIKGLLGL
jgi:hypothetical protein